MVDSWVLGVRLRGVGMGCPGDVGQGLRMVVSSSSRTRCEARSQGRRELS